MSTSTDVVIVGAGPVGLSAALQLGAAGVRTLVLERRRTLSTHPKAVGIHARTMEIFSQWGLAEQVRAAGLPPQQALGFGWMTRVNGIELGRIMLAEDARRLAEYARQSPEMPCFSPQDAVEPIIRDAALKHPCVEVRFASEVTRIENNRSEVGVEFRSAGETNRLSAQYAIAADGVRSPTRRMLGITETASRPYGESVNVYFESTRLDELRAGRPYILWWIVNPDVQGAFIPVSHRHRWIFNFEGDPQRPDSDFGDERCASLICAAAGDAGLDVRVLSVLRWTHEQAVADSWRQGRVFLAGDSAHRFPPHGGFGMNSGIQDTVNLCWKLEAVLRGNAGDGLLDTYEFERKPVAQMNAEQCRINTLKMQETGWLPRDASGLAAIERPEGEEIRQRIASAIPKQREQFYSQGQQFGTIYESNAVLPDGRVAVRSSVSEYRMTSTPGARSPHMWVTNRRGDRISTINLLHGAWLLLAGAEGSAWLAAAARVGERLGVRIDAYRVGGADADLLPEDDARFDKEFEVSPSGMVLVRPDGHVGARFERDPGNAADALASALQRILDR
jgi:putative polyketide hydroxylase